MLFIWLTTLSSFLIHLTSGYFCDLKCINGGTHTVCKYKPCGPHKNCGDGFAMKQLNDDERAFVTEEHNKYRQKVASGGDTQGGNGEASNMKSLSYSKELEFVAQCWANQCNQEGAHDKCRSIEDFEAVGQNMYGATIQGSTTREDLKRGIELWYSEIKLTTASVISSYKHDPAYGHFTQLVWAETEFVGCGRTVYGSGSKLKVVIICNYATGGNFIDETVYTYGKKCSKCGDLKCNSEFNALCGDIRAVEDDDWIEPFTLSESSAKLSIAALLFCIILHMLCS